MLEQMTSTDSIIALAVRAAVASILAIAGLYSPDQPRGDDGKFGEGSGGSRGGPDNTTVHETAKQLLRGGASRENIARASKTAKKMAKTHANSAAIGINRDENLRQSAHYDQVAKHLDSGGIPHDPVAQKFSDDLKESNQRFSRK
jgi:hypothetical protein